MLIVNNINNIDVNAWRQFVSAHPDGNIFQTPDMYYVYENTKNYKPVFVSVIVDGTIKGVLLAVIQKENYGPLSAVTARAIVFGGPLIDNNDPIVLDSILSEFTRIVKTKAVYSQFRNFKKNNEVSKTIFRKYGYVFQDHLNIIVDLNIPVDILWKNVKRNRKDGINKGKKQGFVFNVYDKIPDIDSLYSLLQDELFKRIKLPYPDVSFFMNLNNLLNNNLKCFTLDYNNKPHIILCAFFYNKTMYAYIIGISQNQDFLRLRPVDLFYWEVIKWAAQNGFEHYDWMGAGKPDKDYGVRDFKIQYGGNMDNIGRYERINRPLFYKFGILGLKLKKLLSF